MSHNSAAAAVVIVVALAVAAAAAAHAVAAPTEEDNEDDDQPNKAVIATVAEHKNPFLRADKIIPYASRTADASTVLSLAATEGHPSSLVPYYARLSKMVRGLILPPYSEGGQKWLEKLKKSTRFSAFTMKRKK